MKHNWFFTISFIGLLLLTAACSKEDENLPDFQYDRDNNTAPFFEPGTYEAAARFTPAQTNPFSGSTLTDIEFFILNLPDECEVKVYGPGTATSPGDLLYSANVGASLNSNSWNTHTLDKPIAITGEDLWLSVRVIHGSRTNSIGCDLGPAKSNGDWYFEEVGNGEWLTYRTYTQEIVNINWNIRGYASE